MRFVERCEFSSDLSEVWKGSRTSGPSPPTGTGRRSSRSPRTAGGLRPTLSSPLAGGGRPRSWRTERAGRRGLEARQGGDRKSRACRRGSRHRRGLRQNPPRQGGRGEAVSQGPRNLPRRPPPGPGWAPPALAARRVLRRGAERRPVEAPRNRADSPSATVASHLCPVVPAYRKEQPHSHPAVGTQANGAPGSPNARFRGSSSRPLLSNLRGKTSAGPVVY